MYLSIYITTYVILSNLSYVSMYLGNMKINFDSSNDAIAYANKNGIYLSINVLIYLIQYHGLYLSSLLLSIYQPICMTKYLSICITKYLSTYLYYYV
jgi:hypothetical protein